MQTTVGTLAVYVDCTASSEQRAALEANFTSAAGGSLQLMMPKVLVLLEKAAPFGRAIALASGVAMIAAGLVLAIRY